MSYPVSIKVSAHPEFQQVAPSPFFFKNFDSVEEFEVVANLFDNKRRVTWLESLVFPVRTNNLSNFCKDFFLPGLFNEALKINDVRERIFMCIFMSICDIITFPLRLITAIPRYFYNKAHPKEKHPFYKFLIGNGVSAATLSADYVYLKHEWRKEGSPTLTTQGKTFNFIELPNKVSNIIELFQIQGLINQQQPIVELLD